MCEEKDVEPMTVLSVRYTEDGCIKVVVGRLYCCGDLVPRYHICLSESEYNALGRPSIGDDVCINAKNGTFEMRFFKNRVEKCREEPTSKGA